MPFHHRAAGAAAFAYAITAASGVTTPAQALAAAQDYRFEAAGPPAKSGKATIVKIRLVHLPDGKPVSGGNLPDPVRYGTGRDGHDDGSGEGRACERGESVSVG